MLSRIHRIELHNFKSYVGDVTVGPFKDFTCIVGPNGSGKSNLMDALSFALSTANAATMRGKTMADFISRSAREKVCAVTIVLHHTRQAQENGQGRSAEEETSFTRQMDSSGTTTTLINKKRVSQKHFTEALEAHRVGARVNTFLVFQHEVEAVAHKRAKELTALLESVSGSGELKPEYDSKKAALEVANEALAHASVKKRGAVVAVNQLRLAKKETEKFEEARKRHTEARRDVALSELFQVEVDLERQKAELAKFNEKLVELQKNIASEQEIREKKKAYAELHKTYLEQLKANRKSADELRSRYSTMERINAAIVHLTRKRDVQKLELETLTKADALRSKEEKRLEEEKQRQEALLSGYEAQCAREDAESAATNKVLLGDDNLVEYRRLRKEADCETVNLRQEMSTVQRQRESAQEAARQCQVAQETHALQTADLQEAIQRAIAQGGELERRRKDLEEAATTLEKQIAKAEKDLIAMQRKAKERDGELARIQEQLYELRYMKDSDKQSTRMAETVHALRTLFPIRGRLVDLCTVPNERYRDAVTVALGRNLEAIVVDTTETAIACVRHMKQQRMAPLTFLPLDGVQGTAVDDRVRAFGGTCKPLADVVRFDPELAPAIRYALGQTLVCDAMDEARKVAYGNPGGERYKVVTLDGTMLLRNGSVQGGLAAVQSRSRKWDEKKYEDLRVAREQLLSDVAGAGEADLAKAQIAIRDMSARLEFTRGRLQVVAGEKKAYGGQVDALKAELERHTEQGVELEQRAKRHSKELETLERGVLDIAKSVALVEGRIFVDFQKRVNMPNLLQWEAQQAQQGQQRAERRQQLQLLIHKLSTSIEVATQRGGAASALKDARDISEKLLKEMEQCKKDQTSYQAIITTAKKKHEVIQAGVSTARASLDSLEKEIKEMTANSETEMRRLAHARKGVTGLQAACDTLRMRRLAIVRRCQMDATELPLKPANSAGVKRERTEAHGARGKRGHGEAESGTEVEGIEGLMHSEPFAVLLADSQQNTGPSSLSTSSALGTTDATSATNVCIDFTDLSGTLRQVAADRTRFLAYRERTETLIEALAAEMEALAPNLRVAERFVSSEDQLGTSSTALEEARERARKAHADFMQVKQVRTERFMEAYEKISKGVSLIYQDLTLGTRANAVHGIAYLSLEDMEEPYLGGTTYHATPPMKRYMSMELLSGGERTMAALALLFAIHEVSPTPFFVLDEVDAALDADNVQKLARYLRKNCTTCQFVVVSLKDQLYHMADMLVGVMKDKERESSKVLTMDLRGFEY